MKAIRLFHEKDLTNELTYVRNAVNGEIYSWKIGERFDCIL